MEEQRTFVAKRNRARLVYVPISMVELIFGQWLLTEPGEDVEQYFNRPFIEGIPEGAALVFIAPAPERDALMLKYVHESFEETIEGNMFPEVPCREITFKKVKVEKESNGGR